MGRDNLSLRPNLSLFTTFVVMTVVWKTAPTFLLYLVQLFEK